MSPFVSVHIEKKHLSSPPQPSTWLKGPAHPSFSFLIQSTNAYFFIALSTSELAGTMAHVCVTLTTIVKLQQVTGGQLARCFCHPGPRPGGCRQHSQRAPRVAQLIFSHLSSEIFLQNYCVSLFHCCFADVAESSFVLRSWNAPTRY